MILNALELKNIIGKTKKNVMNNKENEIKKKEQKSRKRKTTNEKILQAIEIHGNRYDYSLLPKNFKVMDKVPIICKEHGEFFQSWDNHISKKQNCPKCMGRGLSLEESIEKANKIHSFKYDYSLIKIPPKPNHKVNLICTKHNEFKIIWDDHINKKSGCSKCAGFNLSLEEKIEKAHEVHNFKYDYSLLPRKFKTMSKVNIICNEHGVFKQCWNNHIHGKDGCPSCKSSKGENEIKKYLENNNIKYIPQKSFNDCINDKTGRKLVFDFYLPKQNICIEYDGKQHYFPVEFFGGVKEFNDITYKDNIKNEFCKNNNIKLIRISYKDKNNVEKLLYEQVEVYRSLVC